MVEAGFIMAAGLMLDTFLVRTILVPAMAVMVGRANWWPSKRASPKVEPMRADVHEGQLSLF
jgi:RND superfamily putative drug exporter